MEKKLLLLIIVAMGGLFIMGARNMNFYSGRFALTSEDVTREYYTYDAEYPKDTQKVQQLFKIDTETGNIWIYKEEYRRDANNQMIIKQYFEQLPVEKSVSTLYRD